MRKLSSNDKLAIGLALVIGLIFGSIFKEKIKAINKFS